ncbi:glycosyltransferase [Bowmanella sp. Y26]|uniref:glycosyltransferase n=1 Tax=Bowmanella yangjiangensis TaxID=2811230 RepID=UPI001BDCFBC5|nr:glycosyltransferase [Bowmanella yangjiangensis]
MSKKVLMIAFHYPPFSGSSGVQRTLRFSQYLGEFGWHPMVLTVNPAAHENISNGLDVPEQVVVKRSLCLDSARHLAFRGKYLNCLAWPDRWSSWIFSAVPKGLLLNWQFKPDVIWSTYPIATAHYIGWAISRLTGKPWVADFRDPMVEFNAVTQHWAPADRYVRKFRLWIEKQAAKHAAKLVFCTDGAKQICFERYPWMDPSKLCVIENGYDEQAFQEITAQQSIPLPEIEKQKKTLLHSGVLYYSSDRNPQGFLQAVRELKECGKVSSDNLEIIFRASGYDSVYQEMINQLGLDDIVRLAPAIPYQQALTEMANVDGLLIFQGATSNPAVPAKLYEYLRCHKPILGLVDEQGETAKLLAYFDMHCRAPLDDVAKIQTNLQVFMDSLGGAPKAEHLVKIQQYSRRSLTARLAQTLNELVKIKDN